MDASPALLGVVGEQDSWLSLLDVEPELGRWVEPEQMAAARNATRVPTVEIAPGRFEPGDVFLAGRNGFGALVVSGLIAHEVSVGGQPSLRLLGPGDMFLDEAPVLETVEPLAGWSASVATHVAVLDDRLLVAIRRWPRLVAGICASLQESHELTLLQLAISHQPRVEDRLVRVFGVLAARWGRVTRDGILIPIALTHEALARMIGARRPTVTMALQALAREKRLRRDAEGRWLLGPGLAAPTELHALTNAHLPRVIPD